MGNALFENPGGGGNWITLLPRGVKANRFGVGLRIEVKITEGGVARSIHRVVSSGGSFGSSSLRQEIGVGSAEVVDELVLRWPGSGLEQVFRKIPVNRFYAVVEGLAELENVDLPSFRLAPDR